MPLTAAMSTPPRPGTRLPASHPRLPAAFPPARRALLAALAVILLLPGCGSTPPASEPVLRIAASPWPLAWLAQQVAPQAQVSALGAVGIDPHDVDLSPAERQDLERAALVIHPGAIDYQPQIEAAIGAANRRQVTVSAAAAGRLRPIDGDDHHIDPHVWLDMEAMALTAQALGDALAELEPQQAGAYQRRATDTAAQLRALDGELAERFEGCRHDVVVVGHAAFAYLLAPHGITQQGISGAGGHSDASPAKLAELSELIRTRRLPAVVSEGVEGRVGAQALARETGVELVEVDSLASPSMASRADGFPALLRELAHVFARVLECGP